MIIKLIKRAWVDERTLRNIRRQRLLRAALTDLVATDKEPTL